MFGWLSNMLRGSQKGEEASCPAVWSEISTALTAQFLADGQCTDAARAAIRASFHDCFNGACDGSLILAGECSGFENRGLERLCENLGNLASQKQVGYGDLIQFAAAHAIKTCPGGPTVPVKIGRVDSDQPNALGVLPGPRAESGDLIKLFASKGFSPMDLAALIGAHTTAKQRVSDPSKAGAALDSTVGTWDNKYYSETKTGRAPFTLPADKGIAQNPITAIPFSAFAVSKGAWDAAFVSAMTKMSMLGVDANGLVDCTSALPGGSRKREIRSSNFFDRLRW
ncbi:heme peroxidase [Phaeosphaeria sp. MPI-PUGE-AT-0046c]|nr:heme peroxidase [Phaeosphaeria sp. MPI-PUGE-AT-0046c]